MRSFGGDEEHGAGVFAGGHAGSATDAGGGVEGGVEVLGPELDLAGVVRRQLLAERAEQVEGERVPRRDVGDACPLVRPYTPLFSTM